MKIVDVSESQLFFDNDIYIESCHFSDCCESHWIDFGALNPNAMYMNTVDGKGYKLNELTFDYDDYSKMIEPVEDIGFFLVANNGTKILVNCYGENNGYYNTNLFAVFYKMSTPRRECICEVDLTKCQDITWI